MNRFVPYSRQCIEDDDMKAVVKTLKSDFITQGIKIKEFEQALVRYCGAKYAVVFSSGTAALHGAYYAAGISTKDKVITPPITFLATTNAAVFLGAHPVFVDIEQDTGNINTNLIERAITKRTKAVVPVHYGGHPADLERIAAIAQEHNLVVIEDACHALGAEYKKSKIGNCRYSNMAVFSFHPVKSITTAEGGAVLANNRDYYERLVMFRQHGVTKEERIFKDRPADASDWYYEMQSLGYNYRLTDIQCALGISQLKKVDLFIEKRRKIVEIYNREFDDNRYFDIPREKQYAKSSWHLYPIRIKDTYKAKKKDFFKKLREQGLGVQVHYIPVYWHPYYQELGYKKGICPNAESFYQREISIPLYQSMRDKDIKYVINSIFKVFHNL